MDSHYKGADKLGRGIGYKYAHLYPKHYVKQQYLPSFQSELHFHKKLFPCFQNVLSHGYNPA